MYIHTKRDTLLARKLLTAIQYCEPLDTILLLLLSTAESFNPYPLSAPVPIVSSLPRPQLYAVALVSSLFD